MKSLVEERMLNKSGMKLRYEPVEKIGVIIVDSFPELGRFTALRFLEWVQNNPGGVISLPTGRTPEYFLTEVQRFLRNWDQIEVQKELDESGINPGIKPDVRSLVFVQIDEFYPINPFQHNSFYYYVNKYYINGFGLDPQKALLINCSKIGIPEGEDIDDIWPEGKVDLSLRYRHPARGCSAEGPLNACHPAEDHTGTDHLAAGLSAAGHSAECRSPAGLEQLQKQVLENIDQWCTEYEDRIRSLGGIGFFLGGIGPDGHIGFNIRGSDLYSTTRLKPTNYETQAAAAQDLGGIEITRKRHVITIGLSTIVYNPECVALIIAAGETKARIVTDSIQKSQHIHYPATALHTLPAARFVITRGAARQLHERRVRMLMKSEVLTNQQIEEIVIELSLKTKKPIEKMVQQDFKNDPFANILLKRRKKDIETLKKQVAGSLKEKIESGITLHKNTMFLHTEPHHDDIMLGYLPAVVRHIREHSTEHSFVTFTSGFTSVTNIFMLNQLVTLKEYIGCNIFDDLHKEGYFDPRNTIGKNRDVWQYLDGVAAHSPVMKDEGRLRRLLRNLIFLYDETDIDRLKDRIDELINYFKTQYPGRKDLPHIQRLKGMCREWEADCLWGYFGWHSDSVHHLRLGFYTGDLFTEEPDIDRDVMPILETLRSIKPDVVTVALDPEASGPDTHYKVLQAITEALKLYEKKSQKSNIRIWGYRNVWYRFHPCEANMFIPVSLNMFALQHNAFRNSFISQKDASFPSYEYDGPFSELAQKIQVEQYQTLKTCLGRSYFYEHESALIRATRGFVFIKQMELEEFYQHSRELRKRTENT
jgi:glucosamine-6-phosphate deaminase